MPIHDSCFNFGFGEAEKSGSGFEPAYLKLHRSGELKARGEKLWETLAHCELCPRKCGVNKLKGEQGFCRAGTKLEISSYHAHFGEERPLVGQGGSGTIFLTHCGLRCVFCINWEISHNGQGFVSSTGQMADMMIALQLRGCININFVTPTHYLPHILLAVDKAASKGLKLPLVYNTCGWERIEMLRFLDGVIDIYLPDFKYADARYAAKYSSGANSYPEITKEAILEMHRQVGTAIPTADGRMHRGLMIRHLVMPKDVSGTRKVIEWIARNLPKNTYLNLMSQYRPDYKAFDYPEISQRINKEEYSVVIRHALAAGLTNLDIQGY
jgi:putative pyruvate formate lyase activating enzyme